MSRDQAVKMITTIRNHWGFALFSLLSFIGFFRLISKDPGLHYLIFVRAARALWNQEQAYATTLNTGLGFWRYSPACGMFFYYPFSLLPDAWGQAICLALSWLIFTCGSILFLKVLQRQYYPQFSASLLHPLPWAQLYWLSVASSMMLAILTGKTEIAMVGILFWSFSRLMEDQTKYFWPVFWLATITNWKFQPLPILGLLILVWWKAGKGLKLPALFSAILAFWYALPYLFLPLDYLTVETHRWVSTTHAFTMKSYIDSESLTRFISLTTGFQMTYQVYQVFTLLSALAFAAMIWVWSQRNQEHRHFFKTGFIYASALGTVFLTVYSPTNQNNGYIWLAPLYIALCLAAQLTVNLQFRRAIKISFWIMLIFMAFAYSDIFPKEWIKFNRNLALKAGVVFLCSAVLMVGLITSALDLHKTPVQSPKL